MRYLKIKDSLYLIQIAINAVKTVIGKRQPVNHIFIFDRSGSMWSTLSGVIQDLVRQAEALPDGDTVSIGWFSSEREQGWICKGLSVTENRGKFEALLRRYDHTLSTTCFSNILADTTSVIEDLKPISDAFSFVFFTDGHPVVSNVTTEKVKVKAALTALAEKLGAAMFVGYSDSYNKEMLADMAKTAGGILVHADNLKQFAQHFQFFQQQAVNATPRQGVKLDFQPLHGFAFTAEQGKIEMFSTEDNLVYASGEHLYALSDLPQGTDFLTTADFGQGVDHFGIHYAAARCLVQIGKLDEAIQVLAKTGDCSAIDQVTQAFTNTECGKVEDHLRVAAFNIGARWPDGRRDYNYVPAADAFCLLDLFDILAADKEAVFLPYHESFEYKRRSRKTKAKEGYPKFEADKSAECKIGDFTWHGSRLNLSLLARIPGVVDLGEEAEKCNFAQKYKTHIWRNYTLIGDGVPNVSKLPVKMSADTMATLLTKCPSILAAYSHDASGPIHLDLTKLPVINQKIASAYLDTDTLCRKILEEQEIKAALKVYKYYLDALKQAKIEKGSLLSTAQEEFLKSKGITANGFAPPTEAEEATDVLVVKELSIAIKGLKALPKVADVEAAMEKGKKLTLAWKIMADVIQEWRKESEGLDDFSKTHWLEREIERLKIELGYVRSYIQRAKFAVVLAKKSFDRVPKLAEATTVEWNDLSFDFSLREVEVKI